MSTSNTAPTTQGVHIGAAPFPCDICGQQVAADERWTGDSSGLTVEHVTCSTHWARLNFGREGLV